MLILLSLKYALKFKYWLKLLYSLSLMGQYLDNTFYKTSSQSNLVKFFIFFIFSIEILISFIISVWRPLTSKPYYPIYLSIRNYISYLKALKAKLQILLKSETLVLLSSCRNLWANISYYLYSSVRLESLFSKERFANKGNIVLFNNWINDSILEY